MEGNPLEIFSGQQGQALLDSSDRPALLPLRISRIAVSILDKASADVQSASQGCDALIYSLPLSVVGYSIAEGLGIPGIPAALYPVHPSREFPSVLVPSLPLRGDVANWVTGFCMAKFFWQVFRRYHNRWRKERLGLPGLPWMAPLKMWEKQGVPLLYGYSPSVIPKPKQWSNLHVVCGYWFLDKPQLVAAKGSPGVLGRRAATVLRRLRQHGRGRSGAIDGHRPRVLPADTSAGCPRVGMGRARPTQAGGSRVFDRLCAPQLAVSPCGRGCTPRRRGHDGGRPPRGVPSIVIPFFADQFFWGKRVHQLGLGPRPIPKNTLSVDKLEQAIRETLDNPAIGGNCRSMAERIGAEDGVTTAAEVVDGYLRESSKPSSACWPFR